MEDITIKYEKLVGTAVMPTKTNPIDAGFNIRSIERVVIRPYSIGKVRTGLAVEVPEGYELQIRGKNSVAIDRGLAIAQGVGTIDSGCRDEIVILLRNIQAFSKIIEPGEIVGQFVINAIPKVLWKEAGVEQVKPERNTPKTDVKEIKDGEEVVNVKNDKPEKKQGKGSKSA